MAVLQGLVDEACPVLRLGAGFLLQLESTIFAIGPIAGQIHKQAIMARETMRPDNPRTPAKPERYEGEDGAHGTS